MGGFGHALSDSLYMPAPLSKPADEPPKTQNVAQPERPAPLVMEFWPTSVYLRDREFSVRTLGMRYTAWWDEKYVPVFGLTRAGTTSSDTKFL